MRIERHLLSFIILFALTQPCFGQGGPPVITDDPWTPRPSHWEINSGWTVEKLPGESTHELPAADINYGWGHRVQLKLEVPYVIASRNYLTHSGVGNFEAGVKWRFLENFAGIAASVYPQVLIPRSRSSAALLGNSSSWALLLPLEAARSFGDVDVDGEIGYWFGSPEDRETMGGIALGYELSGALEFVTECNAEGPRIFSPEEFLCGAGVRADITEHIALMGAVEHDAGGNAPDRPRWRTYFGAQTHVRGGGLWKGRKRQ